MSILNDHVDDIVDTLVEDAEDRDVILDMIENAVARYRPAGTPLVVVVRDPDASNQIDVYGGEVLVHDVDLGYMDLRDPDEFLQWAPSHLEWANQHDGVYPDAAVAVRDLVFQLIPDEIHKQVYDARIPDEKIETFLINLARKAGHA